MEANRATGRRTLGPGGAWGPTYLPWTANSWLSLFHEGEKNLPSCLGSYALGNTLVYSPMSRPTLEPKTWIFTYIFNKIFS